MTIEADATRRDVDANHRDRSAGRRPGKPGVVEIVQMVTAIAAPTTLAAALLLFFGYSRTVHLFLTFGVDVGSLSLSTQDYMLRSVEAIFAPIAILMVLGITSLWAHQVVRRWVRDRHAQRLLRHVAVALIVIGAVLLVRAAVGIAVPDVSRDELIMTPFSLSVGTALTAYGQWMRRALDPAGAEDQPPWMRSLMIGMVVAVMLLGVFWATTNYAQAYGRAVAVNFIRGVQRRPAVTVYSGHRLHLQGAGVTESKLDDSEPYRYRYDGLRLLTESSGHYFLYHDEAARDELTTFVVPATENLRLDLRPD